MSVLIDFTPQLREGQPLAAPQITAAVEALVAEGVESGEKENFLEALAKKGETPAEVAGFAEAFRARSRPADVSRWADEAVDVCGTGGDHAGTFNISTAAAFVVATAGVKVFKHGNRSITSKSGSADLLAAVGINIEAPLEQLHRSLNELNFAFFFAPAFHPAFKALIPVRKALAARGQRTVFNLLGPLINPGRPAHQLLGVFSENWVRSIAATLGELKLRSALVVHSTHAGGGLDEWTTASRNVFCGVGALSSRSGELDLAEAGLRVGNFAELRGGEAPQNLFILEQLVEGRAPRTLADTVALNAGAALWACGRVASLGEGVEQSLTLIGNGSVKRHITELRNFYKT